MPTNAVEIVSNVITVQITAETTPVIDIVETEEIDVIFTPLGERGPAGSETPAQWGSTNW